MSFSSLTKKQQLDQLYNLYKNCIQCPLGTLGRTNVVFGSGNPDSKIIFIGEGPGAQEDLLAEPFVGKSGQLLTKILKELEVKREDIYITNIVKCRPPENRAPAPIEMVTCTSLLLKTTFYYSSRNNLHLRSYCV
jgi:uracil-DNA glycosylase family 4